MSYLHHYPMLLEVPGMIEDTAVGLTPEKVAQALRDMADRVEKGSPDLQQILGRGPVSCQKEDRWVWRSIDTPKVIRKAAGGWVEVEPELIDPEDTCDGLKAAGLLGNAARTAPRYLEHALWVRPENIGGTPIVLEMRGEPDGQTLRADIRDFLAFADQHVVQAFADADWSGPDQDLLVDWLVEEKDPAIIALMLDAGLDPEVDGFEDHGVSVRVTDRERVEAFVKDVRHDISFSEGPQP